MQAVKCLGLALAVAAFCAAAGCSDGRALHRQADQTYAHLVADLQPPAPAPAPRNTVDGPTTLSLAPAAPADADPLQAEPKAVLFFAPRATPDSLDSVVEVAPGQGSTEKPSPAEAAKGSPAGRKSALAWEPLKGDTFGQVLKNDLKEAPEHLLKGFTLSFANPTNLVILATVFGADRVARNNLDAPIRYHMKDHHTSLHATGDLGKIIGDPILHLGVGCAWYGIAVANRDEQNHDLAKVLLEALIVNDLTSITLQGAANQHGPNGKWGGWPSGHTSSAFTVASVLHEYYGWQVGVPAYLLAGYAAASRIEDREHNLSDVIFGVGLGIVVGHSVVKGELPQIGGFTLLPYADENGNGLMLMKQW